MKSKEAERQMGVALKLITTGLSMYARAYNAWAKDSLDDTEYKLGNDYVMGEAWKDIANSVLRSLLSGPFRGYEARTISSEIEAAAKEAGIDLHK